jgi:predicted TIM-barrel enzyme
MSRYGVNPDDFWKLPGLVNHAVEHGWNGKALVDSLTKITSLTQETSRLQQAANTEENRLNAAKTDTAKQYAITTRLQGDADRANADLFVTNQIIASEKPKIEMTRAFFQLLQDPSRASDRQIDMVGEELLRVRAGRSLAGVLPIDFSKIEKEFEDLLKAVLEKKQKPTS